MAITQNEILQLTVSMFNAAPGADYLAEIEAMNAATTSDLAEILGGLDIFTSQFTGNTDAQTATAILGNFGIDETTPAGITALAWVTENQATMSTAQIMAAAQAYLSGTPDAAFADAAATLANKTAVALDYSVTQALSATDLASLQATVSTVDATDASVSAAITANTVADTTLLDAAVAAAYAESVLPGTATATEIAVAAALTLTTADAAIAGGSTQAEIDAGVVVMTTANAAGITLTNIVALDTAAAALSDFIAASGVDKDTNDAGADTVADLAVDAADITDAYDDAVLEYDTQVGGVSDVAVDSVATATALYSAAHLAIEADIVVAEAALADVVATIAEYALTTEIDAVIAATAADTAAIAAEGTATDAADARLVGATAVIESLSTFTDNVTADGVVSVLAGVISLENDLTTTTYAVTVEDADGFVTLADAVTDMGLDATTDAALITELSAMQAELTDWITAYNTQVTAAADAVATGTALTTAQDAAAAADAAYTTATTTGVYTDLITDLSDAQAVISEDTDADGVADAGLEVNLAALESAQVDYNAIAPIFAEYTTLDTAATTTAGDVDNQVFANTDTVFTNTVGFITGLTDGDAIVLSAFDITTDYIYAGTDYTVNAGATTTGDDAVLEMFITDKSDTDDTAVLTFETAAFGSSSASDFFTVELTGVATADITVSADGLILGA